jgi:hypothetical protein
MENKRLSIRPDNFQAIIANLDHRSPPTVAMTPSFGFSRWVAVDKVLTVVDNLTKGTLVADEAVSAEQDVS